MANLKTGSNWNRLLVPGLALCDFFRHGSFCFALFFPIIFRTKIVATLGLLCAETWTNCRASVAPVCQQGITIGEKAKASGLAVRHPGITENLVETFAQLKAAFEIHSNIGGAFIFALVVDNGTCVYKMACVMFFNHGYTKLLFSGTMKFTQCLVAMLVLLMVAEVGHQIVGQVTLQQNKIRLGLLEMKFPYNIHAIKVREVAEAVVAWKWSLSFFMIDRGLMFTVMAVVTSYIIFVFQLKISIL